MKKISLILAFMLTLLNVGVNALETISDKGDKYLSVTREEEWAADEMVTLNVVNVTGEANSGLDLMWEDIANKAKINPQIIAYYDRGTVIENKRAAKNKCVFNIILEDTGIYKCFLSNQSGDIDVFYINHIDSQKSADAADEIVNICKKDRETAINEMKSIIKANSQTFGFFDDLYSIINAVSDNEDKAVGYIYDYIGTLDEVSKKDSEIVLSAVRRAYLIESINTKETKNLYDREYASGIDTLGLEKFVKKQYASKLNEKIMAKTYGSIKEYDKALAETFSGIVIQYNDGSGEIPEILKQFADMSGINVNKITDKLCDSMAGSGDFYTFDKISEYVRKWVEPKSDSNNSNSSSSSGGSGSGSGVKMNPITADESVDIKNDTQNQQSAFDDVTTEHWASAYIDTLYKDGVISGVSASKFEPESNVTREQFVKLIVTALKLNTVGSDAPFNDVDNNEWYADYVNIAYNSDIIKGISNDEFGVGLNITRQDIAVMTANALKVLDYNFNNDGDLTFADSESISDYAVESVRLLKNSGILNGDENNAFNPQANATRAEAAKIIYMISRQ